MTDKIIKEHPEYADQIKAYQNKLENDITAQLKKMDLGKLERTTSASDTIVTVPVVVHVINDYGTEDNVSDNKIFAMLQNLNDFYQLRNDTSGGNTIGAFKPYVGKINFQFKLATKDPGGNPTKGITRRYSYLTYGGDDQAKFDDWNPRSYLNIWTEAFINQNTEGATGGTIVAYAYLPPTGAAIPFIDGVICNAQFLTLTGDGDGATIPHEVGHYFNLYHTFGQTNNPGSVCGDDLVDDTPPTKGELGGCPAYTDTACATGYYKLYPSATPGVDSLVDYPDTANVQNIMNYASCKTMFTKGQAARMRSTINSDVAGRDSLTTVFNLTRTGANAPTPDLPPVADFSIQYNNTTFAHSQKTQDVPHFLCENKNFRFVNQSWNDTVTGANWTFSNGATTPTSTSLTTVVNSFSQPGWVSVSLTATSNAGSNTITRDSAVYVADPTGTNPDGYYEEFAPSGDLSHWPTFNYFNNDFKWSYSTNTGFYDKNCVVYNGYDFRTYPDIYVGTPLGDFDDLFSPAFDLTSLASNNNANLNYMYAGVSRTGSSVAMNDTMEVDYSTDCGQDWTTMAKLYQKQIANNGSLGIPYQPLYQGEWSLQSITIPSAAKTSSTFFRFRYKPGNFSNNFYLDRFNISADPAGVNTILPGDKGIVVAPNPTNGNSYVIVKGENNVTAQVNVTDITGKLIYKTQQLLSGTTRIEIPSSALTAKGMYMVQVITPEQTHTEKLVAY